MENIQQLIQGLINKEVDNSSISNNLAGDVAKETGSSLIDGLKSAVSGGNMGDLTRIFSSEDSNALTSNPVVQNMISSLTSKLGSNVGIDSATAGNFASSILPKVISMISAKIKSGDLNIADILSSFTGGGAGSILDQDGDGKVNLNDAVSAVKKGGLGGMLGGLFK
ncbi:hypothetical protein BC792_102201 [Sphingobacterium allocomposti]|jgi:hypothetical protein|uniref:Uncharacterized protein n=1 Tax=Sphingobacterium allocomposti TaxID=415956 RepID=A0A5S5DSZ6_9SPHI|nr:hypothetical protein [Sphingobacterium composti Yoo et al. 2007 non Ten et al. 2007]TYP97779.1 hypothetical protein BC792_102201 [Sphingobacterium composti Yoo et al. 2007 non Ten et al. 2007]HLS96343.1 hypothetical protein [Sphingobacterium sp.]